MATISTHNGSQISRKHNIRDKSVVSKEKHIDPNGWHEIWLDIPPKKAYKEVFEKDAVRVEHSEMLERYGYQGTEPAYLIVFQYSGHQEVAADFIRFLLSDVDG